MTRQLLRYPLLAAVAAALLCVGDAAPQPAPRGAPAGRGRPKLEPVAETKLLMEGLLQSNFRGLENHLKQGPANLEAWAFVRGQALLIAEGGNLLMLRPPKNAGQEVWMDRAAELREQAVRLAQQASARDVERCQLALIDLAGTCTRCHQNFRVPVQIRAFAAKD
jgi:hypothetical protein